jgi:hypothetical protein
MRKGGYTLPGMRQCGCTTDQIGAVLRRLTADGMTW